MPEQQLSAFLFVRALPNLDLTTLGVWVWDDTSNTPRSFCYARSESYLPGICGGLGELDIDGRFALSVAADPQDLRLRYTDEERLVIDVEIVSVQQPWQSSTSESGGRLRQALWVNGHLGLSDRSVAVDSCGLYSRRWGSPPKGTGATYYCYGISREVEFHSLWVVNDGVHQFVEGQLRRNGHSLKLIDARRKVLRTLGEYPLDIALELRSEGGEVTTVVGETLNAGELQPWADQFAVLCLTQWTIDDIEIWGNDAIMMRGLAPTPATIPDESVHAMHSQENEGTPTRLRLVPELEDDPTIASDEQP